VGNPVSVAVGDFNRDSKLDLVVADELEASVSVLLNTRPPTVRLDRSAVTFGAQSSGTFSPAQTLTITNTGDTPLQISDVRTTTGNADDFVLGGDTCTASPIAATQSCTLGVRFRPSEAGLRRTTLRITSDDPAGFHDVALAGTASVIVAGPPGPRGPRGGRGHRGRRGPAPRVSRVGCKVARRQPARHKVRVRCRVTLNGTRDVRVRTLTVPHAARLSRAGGPGARARTAL
jgi:hypothetical protein